MTRPMTQIDYETALVMGNFLIAREIRPRAAQEILDTFEAGKATVMQTLMAFSSINNNGGRRWRQALRYVPPGD